MRIPVLLFITACGGGSTAIDAGVELDVSIDAERAPDGAARAAVVGSCADVVGLQGLTAEVTDTTGYVPSIDVTIAVGAVARFAYADGGTEHTIVSGEPGMADGLFASLPFTDHGAFTCIRFDAPGRYPIHCDRHPAGLERGTVTVSP